MKGIIGLFLCVVLWAEVGAQTITARTADIEFQNQAKFIGELSSRRRVNTVFDSVYPALAGISIAHVNTFDRSLTFVRRDLVVEGNLPIVVSRNYDSTRQSGDFGPGWTLNLAEKLELTGPNTFIWQDGNGFQSKLVRSGSLLEFSVPRPSSVLRIEAVSRTQFLVTYKDSRYKRFVLIGDDFFLSEMGDRFGNKITLSYDGARLVRANTSEGRFVEFIRNNAGRITSVRDDQGRRVSYLYESDLLTHVDDLGLSRWTYSYASPGLLSELRAPSSTAQISASYSPSGDVISVTTGGAQYRFEYDGLTTRVERPVGSVEIEHATSGFPIRVFVDSTLASKIRYDKKNRVTHASDGSGNRFRFRYSADGNLRRMTVNKSGSKTVYKYRYVESRLIAIEDSLGNILAALQYDNGGNLVSRADRNSASRYTYDDRGRFTSADFLGEHVALEYGRGGEIRDLVTRDRHVRFDYTPTGRTSRVMYEDGTFVGYAYDTLGLRQRTTYSEGASVEYLYDETGNLANHITTAEDGLESTQTIVVDDANKVTRIINDDDPRRSPRIQYDEQGNPSRVVWNKDRSISYGYDQEGRLSSVAYKDGTEFSYEYHEGTADLRDRYDQQTPQVRSSSRVSNLLPRIEVYGVRTQPVRLGVVGLNRRTLRPQLTHEYGAPLGDEAIQVFLQRNGFASLIGAPGTRIDFDKPSNSVFLPPEYVSTNCYVYDGCPSNMIAQLFMEPGATALRTGTTYGVQARTTIGVSHCALNYSWYLNGSFIGNTNGNGTLSGTMPVIFAQAGTNVITAQGYCSYPCYQPMQTNPLIVNVSSGSSGPSCGQADRAHDVDGCSIPYVVTNTLLATWGGTRNDPLAGDKGRQSTRFGSVQGMVTAQQVNGLPCNQHDLCYQTCGSSRSTCDNELESDAVSVCNSAYPESSCPFLVFRPGELPDLNAYADCIEWSIEKSNCPRVAAAVGDGVRVGGSPAYSTRQSQYCSCSN